MVGIFRGRIKVSFKGLITQFGGEMRELWSVEVWHTNLPKKNNIVSCENMSVATPSMLTMPQEEHFGLQGACLKAWGTSMWSSLCTRKPWNSKTHGLQQSRGTFAWKFGRILHGISRGIHGTFGSPKPAQKSRPQGAKEWGFYKTQQVTYSQKYTGFGSCNRVLIRFTNGRIRDTKIA